VNISVMPDPRTGFLVTNFLTVEDQLRSRAFYEGVLGGKVITLEKPCIIKLANSWIILNVNGGATPDKTNSFLHLRVADIQGCCQEWQAKGAHFLTRPPRNNGCEERCYLRDPDGYVIEVGQSSQEMINLLKDRDDETA